MEKRDITILILLFVLIGGLSIILYSNIARREDRGVKTNNPNIEFVSKKTVNLDFEIPDLYEKSIELNEEHIIRGRFYLFEGNILKLVMDSDRINAPVVEITMTGSERYFCYPRFYSGTNGEQVDVFDTYLDTTALQELIMDRFGSETINNDEMVWFKNSVELGEAVEVRFANNSLKNKIPIEVRVYKNNGC